MKTGGTWRACSWARRCQTAISKAHTRDGATYREEGFGLAPRDGDFSSLLIVPLEGFKPVELKAGMHSPPQPGNRTGRMEGVSSGVHPRSKLNLQRDSATDPTVSGIEKFWKMLMGISKSRIQHCWAHSSGSGQESTEKPLDSALPAFTDHPCAQKTFMQASSTK